MCIEYKLRQRIKIFLLKPTYFHFVLKKIAWKIVKNKKPKRNKHSLKKIKNYCNNNLKMQPKKPKIVHSITPLTQQNVIPKVKASMTQGIK